MVVVVVPKLRCCWHVNLGVGWKGLLEPCQPWFLPKKLARVNLWRASRAWRLALRERERPPMTFSNKKEWKQALSQLVTFPRLLLPRRRRRKAVDWRRRKELHDVKKISAQPCKRVGAPTPPTAHVSWSSISLPVSLNFLCVTCFVSIMQF